MEYVILVDKLDQEIGLMEKIEAHEKGLLHRAFSVLVFNNQGQMLLQKRALSKYHSPGLWTNTCCSHPRKGESTLQAAHRRLKEEMGFDCELTFSHAFIYKVQFDNQLYEHELDHVFLGTTDLVNFQFNPEEVKEVQFFDVEFIKKDVLENEKNYTAWFKIIFENYITKQQLS